MLLNACLISGQEELNFSRGLTRRDVCVNFLPAAERDTGMTTNESDMNLDTNSEEYTGGSGKKTSMFGKLKDKTKNKVSQIKSKVGKKKSGGTPSDGSIESDSPADSHENDDERGPDEDEGEEEETSTDVSLQSLHFARSELLHLCS